MTDAVETAAYAGSPAWHRKGNVVAEAMTSKELMEAAGLDWTVQKFPMFAQLSPATDGQDAVFTPGASPDRFALVRNTDSKIVGICGSRYQILQNHEALDFADGLLQDGTLRYEAAASLHGGKKVFALARMGEDFQIGDDHYTNFMLFKWGHDGGQAIQVFPTNVRVECDNMLVMATSMAFGKKNFFSIAHDSRMEDRLAAVSKALQITTEVQRRTAAALESFLMVKVSDPQQQLDAIVEDIFGKADDQKDGKYSGRKQAGIARYRAIANEELVRNGSNVYSLVQGITGFADWGAPKVQKNENARIEWVVDGTGLNLKRQFIPNVLERNGVSGQLVLA